MVLSCKDFPLPVYYWIEEEMEEEIVCKLWKIEKEIEGSDWQMAQRERQPASAIPFLET